MTQAQLTLLFETLNTDLDTPNLYMEDAWLNMNEISEIILESDQSLYPDDTIQFMFDSVSQTLLMRKGFIEGTTFIPLGESFAGSIYDNILGFAVNRPAGKKAAYRKGASA
jgi:hypothetical protein